MMGKCMTELVNKLMTENSLSRSGFAELLKYRNKETTEYLFEKAKEVKAKYYDNEIYIRGKIELSNYCKNNCYYCGLRRDNIFIPRYRMDESDIISFCDKAYEKGVRTFVLTSGDDIYFTEDKIAHIIEQIKKKYNDCVVELSLGERNSKVYRRWFEAGAERYTLWHETADEVHFKRLHPLEMSLLRRKQSLWELKEIGYEVGSGFMVGVPYQMVDNVVEDILFLKTLDPQIIRVVPFIPTPHTKFEHERSGNGDMTLYITAILRLMFPRALIGAEATLDRVMPDGRKSALDAGVNEVLTSITNEQIKEYYYPYYKTGRRKEKNDLDMLDGIIKESGNKRMETGGSYRKPPAVENLYGQIHHIMRP